MMKDTLPSKPSELLFTALVDMEKAEKSKKYEINMGLWHVPVELCNGESVCQVCFAGATLAYEKRLPASRNADFANMPASLNQKALALDGIRKGQIGDYLRYLGGVGILAGSSLPLSYTDLGCDECDRMPEYRYDREEWWLHMQTILGILQAEGL